MARIQVVYSDPLEPLLDQRVSQLRRASRSHYCAQLIEDDLNAAGLIQRTPPTPAIQEFIAKLHAAAAANPAIVAKLDATLRASLRQKKTAA